MSPIAHSREQKTGFEHRPGTGKVDHGRAGGWAGSKCWEVSHVAEHNLALNQSTSLNTALIGKRAAGAAD